MKKKITILLILITILCLSNTNNTLNQVNLTASYYSNYFNGKRCANGALFNNNKLSAASNIFPLNTLVRVTNLLNGKSIIVKITDRIHKRFGTTRIDLSKKAFASIGDIKSGLINVLVEQYSEIEEDSIKLLASK